MAQMLVDDFTEEAGAETHTFSIDDRRFAIDLVEENLKEFLEILQPYIDAGRPIEDAPREYTPARTVKRATTRPGTAKLGLPAQQLSAIRDWARSNGWPNISDRGRVSREVMDAFEASHKGKVPAFSHA